MRLTEATYVEIGLRKTLRDGQLVTAEGWAALAAFIAECLGVLGTRFVHD